ncbi:MAG: hydantoinase/oxoprolinase family protein, partial [Actinomycetota bacterium]|nr:hydantoinase/oxoprolinase family protein [Actinomycetota bacterium]
MGKRLINIDNGGTLTDVCVVDGGSITHAKTLTTPYDLSRCLFDGLTKASQLIYGEPQLAALLQSTDYIRYSTTEGTNALIQRQGPRLGLLTNSPQLAARMKSEGTNAELFDALVGEGVVTLD